MQVNGSRILLTGATGGIGGAIARALTARGATLILTGRRSETLDSLAAELSAHAVVCDLADRAELERLVRDSRGVDALIANAAMPGSGWFTDLTQTEIDRMLEVNLRAPIALARALAPAMVAQGRGHLVFISSLNGRAATPATSIYSAAKFGLRGFALGIRQDLRSTGVGVSLVLPGFVSEAGLFADADVELPPGVGTRTPKQVADAVIKAIEHNRAEIDVAPLGLRLGARIASVAPELAASVSRIGGADRIAAELAAAQREKL